MANITTELVELRTREAKHFATDEVGTFVSVIQTEQHFHHQDGYWEETGNLIQQQTDGTYKTQGSYIQFQIDPATGTYFIHHQGNTITFQPAGIVLYDTSNGSTYEVAEADPSPTFEYLKESNCVTWRGVFPDVDMTLGLNEYSLYKRVVFNKRPNLPDLLGLGMNPDTTRLVITFVGKSEVPVNLVQGSTGETFVGFAKDMLYIDYGNGSRLAIPMAIGWGSGNRPPRSIDYVRDQNVNFGIAADYSFIQAARYPVTIDPTITIQTNNVNDDVSQLSTATGSLPIPLTYSSNTTDNLSLNYLPCGAYVTGGGKDPLNYQAARYICRFNLTSIPPSSTLTSATLALNVNSGDTTNLTNKIVECIPSWATTGVNPGSAEWNAAPISAAISASTSGTLESYVFNSVTLGTYTAFRVKFKNEATNVSLASLYTPNGYPLDPTKRPKLTVIYTAPVGYPTPTLVEYNGVTGAGVTITKNLPVVAGDLLFLVMEGTVTILPWSISFSCSDNLGNTYTKIFSTADQASQLGGSTMAAFYCVVTVPGTPTITVATPGFNGLAISVAHFTGCNFVFDNYAQIYGNALTTPFTTGILTTSTTNTLIVAGVGQYTGISTPATFTAPAFPPATFTLAGQNATATGSYRCGAAIEFSQVSTWNLPVTINSSTTVQGGFVAAAFKLTSSGGGGGGLIPRYIAVT